MSLSSDKIEVAGVVTRTLDNLALTITSKSAREGANMRQQIGEVRTNYAQYIKSGEFMQQLLDCFVAAKTANVPLQGLAYVREQLFLEEPEGEISQAIVQAAIGFCLSAESSLITQLEFTSRVDIETLMKRMTVAFNTARDLAADADDSSYYQNLTWLSGALISYLATTSRPLPQMVEFDLPISLPALTLSNRIYYTADRWEEVVAENKIIHPAFCPRHIVGLAS
jgi:hypothetical protein